jgi:hypothetical protein
MHKSYSARNHLDDCSEWILRASWIIALCTQMHGMPSVIPFEVLGNPINTAADYDAVRRKGRLRNIDAVRWSSGTLLPVWSMRTVPDAFFGIPHTTHLTWR